MLITNLMHFFNVFISLLYMFQALGCLKHVEKWNKHIKKVRQVAY